jgi:hypothetical protein
MKKLISNLGTVILLTGPVHSQTIMEPTKQTSFLKKSTFCQPFISENESYLPKLEVHLASNSKEYDLSESGKAMKVFQYTALGLELPWFSQTITDNDLPQIGWAVSTQISSHLWWDPLEYSTSPVLNTDYRLGTIQFKFINYFYSSRIKNFSIKFSPFNHESTHLGDELTLFRERKGYPIKRVNVSYEYSELQFTLNDPGDSREIYNSFRFGAAIRINGAQDYYTMSSNEGDSTLVVATGLTAEYFLQCNFRRKTGWLTNKKWSNVFSVELRNRPVYNYPVFNEQETKTGSSISNDRCFSLNTYFGWRYEQTKKAPTIGLYLHCYTGQNPHGQFRNRVDFRSVGLSVILE